MSAAGTQVTNPSAFTARSLGKQVLFAIITLGIYNLYWFHITHKQLANGTDSDFNPTMRTVGLFIPLYNFLVMWKTSNDCEAVTDQSGAVLFVFLLLGVTSPLFWYFVQSGINGVASR